MTRAAVWSLALLLSAAHSASAGPPPASGQRIGVVPFSSGDEAEKAASSVERSVVKALRGKRRQVKVLDRSRADRLRTCLQQASCARTLASKYGFTVMITGHVEKQGDGFHLDLRAISGSSGEPVAVEAEQLASAREDQLVQRLTKGLLEQAGKARPVAQKADNKGGDSEEPGNRKDISANAVDKGDAEDPIAAQRKREAVAAAVAAQAKLPPPKPPKTFLQRYWPSMAAGVVGVAAIGVGIGFGAKSQTAVDQGRQTTSQIEAQSFLDTAKQNAKVANIMFGVGGGVLGVAAVLLVLELLDARAERQDAEQRDRLNHDRGVRAPLHFGIMANGTGIFAGGEF